MARASTAPWRSRTWLSGVLSLGSYGTLGRLAMIVVGAIVLIAILKALKVLRESRPSPPAEPVDPGSALSPPEWSNSQTRGHSAVHPRSNAATGLTAAAGGPQNFASLRATAS